MLAQSLLVAAIDFGTSYSGWAYSFAHDYKTDRTKAEVSYWYSGTRGRASIKTPTCILIKPDGETVEAFGYDAQNKYEELLDRNIGKNYYYFKEFKMKLHQQIIQKIDHMMLLKDEGGKVLPAIKVFSLAIQFLKEHLLEHLQGTKLDQVEADISWVLTVPAIWSDAAKQFMRMAAVQAGIPKERVTIALEPEAASVYCTELPVEKTVGRKALSTLQVGNRFMIIDCGGGTVDITVHEVVPNGGLKEVAAASGGGWGGTMVDRAYEDLLIRLFGREVYQKFVDTCKEDNLDLWRSFEVKKCYIKSDGDVKFEMPRKLIELLEEEKHVSLEAAIYMSHESENLKIVGGDKIKCSGERAAQLFQESIQKTVKHVKKIQQKVRNLKAVLMVGGYSGNLLLQEAIKSACPNLDIVIPAEPQSSILRGAVMYGHRPGILIERALKYTYGIECTRPFLASKHPRSKKINSDRGERCANCFSKIVEKEQKVKSGQMFIHKYFPLNKAQRALVFKVYISEETNPEFTDYCNNVGTLTIEIPNHDPKTNLDREFTVSMSFGGTEIEMQAKDNKTGQKVELNLHFLG